MKATEYAKMAEMENKYWWHLGRKNIIETTLKKNLNNTSSTILNIGCGTGGLIKSLARYGTVHNVDTSKHAIEICRQQGYQNLKQVTGISLPYKSNSFDLLVATDVLEHIQDDSRALKEWKRVLKPGGKLIITVPAYQWLWSSHDESLHHYRRYAASGLHMLTNLQGLRVKKRTYIILFSFPLIVGYRILRGVFPEKTSASSYVELPKPINTLFFKMLCAEGKIINSNINLPFGTSILMIAEKPFA